MEIAVCDAVGLPRIHIDLQKNVRYGPSPRCSEVIVIGDDNYGSPGRLKSQPMPRNGG